MAKPRIFISSTYFDLRNIRSDLERYIKERNYDPILNEKGHIAYSSVKRLEEYCYKEIENCDIVISIIGGRFGSTAHETDGYSISQKELKTAFDKGKQVYIFIEKAVLHEYRTYEKNKEDKELLKRIKFSAVDNIKIYEFLDEVFNLPVNNQYTGFETSNEIIQYLQEQWSSLFQSLLQDASKQKEIFVLEDLKSTAKTLNQLVTFLTIEKKEENNNIKEILFMNHPIFNEIKTKLKLRVRVFFYNLKELTQLLKLVGFEAVDEEHWDDPSYIEFYEDPRLLKIDKKLFDESGKLILYTPEEWEENFVVVVLHTFENASHELDDDLPF
ncbi:DUF4062 domain-containing protein [Acinetobacter johnsonii]|uniref:DUF4062 domain-containing protein n=1 Tax=Acinetobacter johnsonii TaxID=40214 RepID=UPI00244AD01C|nr:DUF4062 domain-containing protein [Acinetobacter johnsonii]MDH1363176.1 DUF4062 domain-containing protein [Acinetobacter johnsonii]MDH1697754.1 DUF4062 domain-containing protein [Acinetobacter johnsonii]